MAAEQRNRPAPTPGHPRNSTSSVAYSAPRRGEAWAWPVPTSSFCGRPVAVLGTRGHRSFSDSEGQASGALDECREPRGRLSCTPGVASDGGRAHVGQFIDPSCRSAWVLPPGADEAGSPKLAQVVVDRPWATPVEAELLELVDQFIAVPGRLPDKQGPRLSGATSPPTTGPAEVSSGPPGTSGRPTTGAWRVGSPGSDAGGRRSGVVPPDTGVAVASTIYGRLG